MASGTDPIYVGIIRHTDALTSSVFGLNEMFHFANRIDHQYSDKDSSTFVVSVLQEEQNGISEKEIGNNNDIDHKHRFDILIVPPSNSVEYTINQHSSLINFISERHEEGAIACSVCTGAFILAETGLVDGRCITTHWELADRFKAAFPNIELDTDRILINDGDIITAGGLTSWIDLGLEIVGQFMRPNTMIELGKYMIVDTAPREQRYYKGFTIHHNHGDKSITKVQHFIQNNYNLNLSVDQLAKQACLGKRTFLRHFIKATGLTPGKYVQKVRIQKARELIETTSLHFDQIALQVGYEDPSAFGKVFKKDTGLPPKECRKRFGITDSTSSQRD